MLVSNGTFEDLTHYEHMLHDDSYTSNAIRIAVGHLRAMKIREQAALDEVACMVRSRKETIDLMIAMLERECQNIVGSP